MLSLFCGFMIPPEDIPSFWTFIYWLNPLHYALEGVYVTQFHNDNTIITLFNGRKTTAEDFVFSFFSSWDYENRIIDFIVLLIFILALR